MNREEDSSDRVSACRTNPERSCVNASLLVFGVFLDRKLLLLPIVEALEVLKLKILKNHDGLSKSKIWKKFADGDCD